jgi:O-acetyl-ADP-ribose deacetylase (regulator of RNase III)
MKEPGVIKLIKGDLFSNKSGIIAHGVNTKGSFGSGVAGQIAKKYPYVRDEYLNKFNTEGWKLGEVQFIFPPKENLPIFANVATQENFGYDGKIYASYDAIEKGMNIVINYANGYGDKVIMPMIGCGLGGLNSDKVMQILTTISKKYPEVNIEIYHL